ncbi:HAD hydrolase-like protein [Treponema sp. C6A8]|uniref:HAD hydrolase-like protein n=1 Tax=Treponema sp. C6A8 TaxID=1410609 RepID=UPI000481F3D4|nr:HAD hydrolase-like protein [Treponema sp. C6A8]
MKFEYIFFDLDGTLTDSQDGILNSFRSIFKHFDIKEPEYEVLRTYIGPPLVLTVGQTLGFTGEKLQEAVKVFRNYYDNQGYKENRLYDGIPQTLQRLKALGCKLSVATSKPEHTAIKIMEHFDIAKYFDNICGSLPDESRSKKTDVIEYAIKLNGITDRSKILMVGDRKFDVEGAHQSGLKCAGVLFGYGSREEFEAAAADYIVEKPEDLEKLI